MNCTRCGGLVWDFGDDISPRCTACGRALGAAPTQAELNAAGIGKEDGGTRRTETAGRKGRHGRKGAQEYSPAHLGLVRPLSQWRR